MSRPRRGFPAGSFELEGRVLLAIVPAALPSHALPQIHPVVATEGATIPATTNPLPSRAVLHIHPVVGFEGTSVPSTTTMTTKGTTKLSQVVTQQDGEATVSLSGYVQPGSGTLQVVVATDPSSPAVGVNVGAVDQTLTFGNGGSKADVSVPILAGAPNPGEVDVNLTITPIDPPPDLKTFGPLELRILASPALIPPTIASTQGTPRGIVLTFSKPMDPTAASNVNNYSVRATSTSSKTNPFLVPIDLATIPLHFDSSIATKSSNSTQTVPLRAAEYDPATNSVTLIPSRKLAYAASITVSQGHPTKASGRLGAQSNPGPGLTDLEGNPINGETTPGKFQVSVLRRPQTTP
jgi:hypothetical protein